MAFFDLNKKVQVILIASSLTVAPGCKPPAVEPPDSPDGDKPDKGTCQNLGLEDIDVTITRVNSSQMAMSVALEGVFPKGTELSHKVVSDGLVVVNSDMHVGAITVELDHSELKPGDTETVVIEIAAVCGANSATYKERIHLCKQAGGVKILETSQDVCQGPPPPQPDTWTQPDVMIVDPPPPPWDGPPPPADPPPPPILDPAPPPNKDPAPPPFLIVDCVPDAMDPGQSAVLDPGIARNATHIRTSLDVTLEPEGQAQLKVSVQGPGADEAEIRWSATGGTLQPASGPATRWTPPDKTQVHAVMATVIRGAEVRIETWRRIP